MVGTVIANTFRLQKAIGSGAMGTIYKAEQISLQKSVVIKLLHSHLTGDATLAKRFHREAKAASLLNHPNCIGILDFGQSEDGMLYIAMEFIAGPDLAELIYEQFPLEPPRIISMLKQVCAALDEAHANGVVHRDLKPENIMVTERRHQKDFVKVLDFGIAKLQENTPGGAGTFQTMAGVVCGTPEYMSPEQARGEKLDGRSDLYSIGVVLYQMLTGTVPFEGDSPLGVVTQHLSQAPTPPSAVYPHVAPSLERLCLSLLEKKREARPPTAMDVVAELERCERELEAMRAADGAAEDDRTIVELRPSQMAELEAARQQYRDKVASVRASQAEMRAAQSSGTEPAQPVANGDQLAAGDAGRPRQADAGASNIKLWLVTVSVAIVVAILGFFIYRAVAKGAPEMDAVDGVEEASPAAAGLHVEDTPRL